MFQRTSTLPKRQCDWVLAQFTKGNLMQLIASSKPGEVDRYAAIDLLVQRSVLTRLVCRELVDRTDGEFSRWRTGSALRFLLQWLEKLPGCEEYHGASYGIDSMSVPDDCLHLLEEIRDGARVCDALAMLQSADTQSDYMNDMMHIDEALEIYWHKHGSPALPPPLHSL